MHKTLLTLMLLPLMLLAQTPDAMWKDAFDDYDRAERALKEKSYNKADEFYSKALAQFLKLRVEYSDWEKSSVNYRINDCESKLKNLKNKLKVFDQKEFLKIKQERDKYSKAMIIAYKRSKKYAKEIELLKALLSEAQKDASFTNYNDTKMNDLTLEKRKLELKLSQKDAEIAELKSMPKDNKELEELKSDKQALELELVKLSQEYGKKYKELESKMSQQSLDYDNLKFIHAEQKSLLQKVENQQQVYLGQVNIKDLKINELNQMLLKQKEKLDKLVRERDESRRDLGDVSTKSDKMQKSFFKQVSDLQKSLNAEKAKNNELQNSVRVQMDGSLKEQTEELKRLEDLNKLTAQKLNALQARYDKLHNEHQSQVILNTQVIAKNKTQNQALRSEVKNLEDDKNELIAKNQTSLDDLISVRSEMSLLKKQFIDKETSFTNRQKKEIAQLQQELSKVNKDNEDNKALVQVYVTRLNANSVSLKNLQDNLKSYEMKNKNSDLKIDQEKLGLIEKLDESEKLNKQLNNDLISLRKKYLVVKQQSSVKDDELIKKYLLVKKSYDKLKLDYEFLSVSKSEGQGVGFVKQEDSNVDRNVKTYIYDAYKAANEGRYQVALGFYAKALELDPNSLDALLRTGLLYYQLGQMSEAERYLNKAFYINPDDNNVLIPLAMTMIDKSDYHMGVSLLSRAASLDPESDQIRMNLGVAMQALGWEEAALLEMEKAYELNDEDAQIAINLAVLYLSQTPKQIAEAKLMYAKAKDLGAAKSPLLEELLK